MPDIAHDMKNGHRGLFLVLGVFVCAMTAAQVIRSRVEQPTQAQRIAAILVSWGLSPPGLAIPVDQRDIEVQIDLLRSPVGEDRVRAAHWLAARGVRGAGEAIATAMADPVTGRPCQLAHALGRLGDERWADNLVRAANQRSNTDLRVCATIGLRSLASDRTVDALIEISRSGTARATAIESLGMIGHSAAVPHLRSIAQSGADARERLAAETALRRIEILSADDPVPALQQQLQQFQRRGHVDGWAVRWLAIKGDHRAVGVLTSSLTKRGMSASDREQAAAALLALGQRGGDSLRTIASASSPGRAEARAALSLLTIDLDGHGAIACSEDGSVQSRRDAGPGAFRDERP